MPWSFLSKGGGISYQEVKPGGHGVKEWPRSWKRGQGWPGVGVRWKKIHVWYWSLDHGITCPLMTLDSFNLDKNYCLLYAHCLGNSMVSKEMVYKWKLLHSINFLDIYHLIMALPENNNHACNNISTLCGTKNHLPNKSYSPSCYIKLFKVQNYIVYLMQEGKNWNDHGITWMLDEALNSMNIKVSIHKSENYDTICQRYQIWMFWALERSFCIWNFPCNHGLFVCNAEVIFSNVLFVPWDIFAI